MAPISIPQYTNTQGVVDQIEHQFTLSPETLVDLTKAFLNEFELGLGSYGQAMAMIPTFVTGVPDGTETGTFLALDLGGTNMRVCEVVLNGDKTFNLVQQKFKVSEALKSGEASTLFDYLADSVHTFLITHATTKYASPQSVDAGAAPTGDVVHLGLTFSFPVEQTALGAGKILTWTKGFSATGAVGNDVVKLLQDAFDRKSMHVKCIALVNDTVGTLLSRSYIAGGSVVGAIFGTGTNGAYIEEVAKIRKLANTPVAAQGGYMVVNTEWGAFNNSRSHLPFTSFDNAVDRLSINPGFQAFEKFISGMYLGEIARQVVGSLVDAVPPILFGGKGTPVLNAHYGLDTSFMSNIETAWDDNDDHTLPSLGAFDQEQLSPQVKVKLDRIRQVIVEDLAFQSEQVTLKDAAIVRTICYVVARRAATLSGVALATVLIQTDYASLPGEAKSLKNEKETINVGVDGSLIEKYPEFEKILRESLRVVVGENVEKRVDIGLAKDGSGVGAALCALQALKQTH
ncbi:hypothetical protein K443DRAFT_672443 [Laccaria amethystina LaAM-08-1]|uniref:Phosphotransferase n=1 Tax=Laccaria amethystina LaAM-08-1 TaxID=1095629 RepID=A0A0C9X875_9AGAR|nr:hypothetical protein K443DRAFT_672443 [Laccaria amethystina LaAM-08-1]